MLFSTEIDFYVDHVGIVIPAPPAPQDEVQTEPSADFSNPVTGAMSDDMADGVSSAITNIMDDGVDSTVSDIAEVSDSQLDPSDITTDAMTNPLFSPSLGIATPPSAHSTQSERHHSNSGGWKYLVAATASVFLISCSQASAPKTTVEVPSPAATTSTPQITEPPAESAKPVQAVAVASEPSNAASHTNTLENAESLADQAATLAESAQSNDDWGLVNHRLERAIAMLESIPSSSPEYSTARAKRAEYENLLNDSSALSSRLIEASVATSEAATMPTTPVAMASGFSCADERSANEGTPVELSHVQLMVPSSSGDLQLLGCITNHTNQTISNIALTYRGVSSDNPSIVQSGIDTISVEELSPGQTTFFRGGFGISRAVTDVTVESITWAAPGSEGPNNTPSSVRVSR